MRARLAPTRRVEFRKRGVLALLRLRFAPLLLVCALSSFAQNTAPVPSEKPKDAPAEWKPLIGEYASSAGKEKLTIFENGGALQFAKSLERPVELHLIDANSLRYLDALDRKEHTAQIRRDAAGRITAIAIGGTEYQKQDLPSGGRATPLVRPQRPVEQLWKEALSARPPVETGNFRKPELVELRSLNPDFHLDIRYATSSDFLGTPVYTQARAFLQRPAAEALARVGQKLESLGYGLLVHDGYRPWYVTKIFWDATPPEGRIFVADPLQGSRHNRGCAVDLSLYDRATGRPVEMTGAYDEMSPRSYPDYIGGTSLQRWHRDLLRRAMESEGFTVYEYEWWHFDYKNWHEYPILNIPFEMLGDGAARLSAN